MPSLLSTVKPNPRERLSVRLVSALVLLIWAGIVLLASQAGTMRLWGLNYLAFTAPGVIWSYVAAVAVALIYVLYPWPVRDAQRSSAVESSPNSGHWRYGVLLAIAVGCAGWLLRAQVGLLGDGIMRASDALQIGTPMPSELLPSALSMFLARHSPAGWGIDGYNTLRIISVASGVMLTLGLWWLVPRAGIKRPYWFIFWVLTFGSFRLFAGYIESYAPAVAFAILWTVASVAYRRGNVTAFIVIILWVLAFLSHATLVLLAPATFFVLFWGKDVRRPNWRPALFFVVVAGALGAYIGVRMHELQIGGLGAGAGYFFLSLLLGPPHNYGVLSLAHLADLLNHLILLAPAFFVALIASMIGGQLQDGTTEFARRNPDTRKREAVFWILAAGVPAVVGLLLDPKLGWPRDWDLFTLFFAPALAGAALWLAGIAAAPVRRAAVSVALVSLSLWLVFSVDADSELRRYEALLELDPSRGDYGHEILALHYRETNRPLGEIEHYKQALEVTDNIRYRANIAAAYMRIDRDTEAIRWYREILDRDSTYDPALYGMAIALRRLERFAEALPYAEAAVNSMPQDPERHFTLGTIQSRMQDLESALPHLEFAARARADEIGYLNPLGGCYQNLRRYQEARTVWNQVIRIDPAFAPTYLNLAHLELTTENFAEARRYLGQYERLVPPDQRRPEAGWFDETLSHVGH
jgi:tetratricopeptide (TPR) repeat protein